MEDLRKTFNATLVVFTLITFFIVLTPWSHGWAKIWLACVSLIPYITLFILGNLAFLLNKEKDREIEELRKTGQEMNRRIKEIREAGCALYDLLLYSGSSSLDATRVAEVINSQGFDWWNERGGKKMLSRLFFHSKFFSDSERVKYILDFTAEVAAPRWSSESLQGAYKVLLPSIFSVLSSANLDQVLAGAYYLHAVSLVNGRTTDSVDDSTEKIVRALKETEWFTEELMDRTLGYAEKMVEGNPDSMGRDQEILAIIKSKITRDKLV